MAQVVTVMNMKGGVGKTTISMHLAAFAARQTYSVGKPGMRVLAIDYDPQFNLSQSLLKAKTYYDLLEAGSTILSVLLEDDSSINSYELHIPGSKKPPSVKKLASRVFTYSKLAYLDLVPSTLDLMYLALSDTTESLEPIEERFNNFISECRSEYDLIVLDCHPAGSIFTKTSLRNSDHVLIPVAPQKYSVRGVGLMMDFIEAKKQNSSKPKPHILFNGVPRIGISQEELQIRSNPKFAKHCMTATAKKFAAFSDPQEGKNFCWQSSKPYSTQAFINMSEVTKEFLARIQTP